MADIFLSYKKEDRVIAERLVAALRKAGKSVWWDDALNPQQAWDAMIEREIAAAAYVVVLWTPRSVTSDWVRSEAHYAQDHHKLVPVTIEHCSLPLAFMLRQSVDLSTGVFDESNSQWDKLLSWLEGEHPEVAPGAATLTPDAAAVAAVPFKAQSGEGWLRPAKRPVFAMGFGALAIALLGALFLFRADLGLAKPVQPDVVVDRFTARGDGIAPGFAESLSNEMFNGFSTSSRINPVNGDGKRRPHAYQLTGDVSTEGDQILVIAKLFAPDIEAPVSTIKFAQPKSNPIAARQFGLQLAEFTRCVATASDSTGSKLVVLPTEAIAPWSRFCQQVNSGTDVTSAETLVATLRSVVAAAPNFANGWSNLSENLLIASLTPGADRVGLIAEAAKSADRALSIDATTAKAYQVKAWLTIGLAGDPKSGSAMPHFHDFAAWEELARKSISVRPSDCGCELPNYSFTLTALGRPSAGLPLLQQAVGNDPNIAEHAISLANLTAATGNPTGGLKMLDDLAVRWPGNKSILLARFGQAIWRRDWTAARTALPDQPDSPAKAAWSALVDALQAGDAGRIHAAGAPFLAIAADPATNSGLAITGLSLSGYPDQAVDALTAAIDRGDNVLSLMFRPSFAEARKTAKFAALTQRMGLIDYWKIHRPDFCAEPAPASLCTSLARS